MQLYGWDTVWATNVNKVNQELINNSHQLISTFDYQLHDDAFNADVNVKGTFAQWQIVAGGSGKLLHLQTTIQSGTMQVTGLAPQSFDLTNVSTVLEVQLDMLPSRVGQYNELKFNFKEYSATSNQNIDGAVTPVSVNDPDHNLKASSIATQLLLHAVSMCLIANLSEISYVFAKLNLVDPTSNSWLLPKGSIYHYISLNNNIDQYLCILSSLVSTDVSMLPAQVDPALLPGTRDASLAISSQAFLQYVVKPSLPEVYGHGTTDANFTYSGNQITNNGNIGCDGCKVGLVNYYPTITGLQIVVDDNALRTSLSGNCDISGLPHAYFDWSVGLRNQMTFDSNSKSLSFSQDPSPTQSHSNHIPWYDYLMGAGIGAAVVAILCPIIANDTTNSLSTGTKLTMAAHPPQTVEWGDTKNFNVLEAGLSGAFYMKGELELCQVQQYNQTQQMQAV